MGSFRVNATVSWQFDGDVTYLQALEMAKKQLDFVLDTCPHGEEYENFTIQVDVAQMKDRKRLIHIAEFEPHEVLDHITSDETRREYIVNEKSYFVRMNSHRYFIFKNNPSCVACGIVGNKMILDINPGDQNPHFNLYAEENGRLVLMTKDHIIPKANGGHDVLNNYQSMCSTCNNLKGCYDLTLKQIKQLRDLYKNEAKLPRKELRQLINKTRERMAIENKT